VWAGDFYELWRREDEPRILAHAAPAAPGCRGVRGIARKAEAASATLAAAPAPDSPRFVPSEHPLPFGWAPLPDGSGSVQTVGPGEIRGSLRLPRPGVYEVWLAGSFGRPVRVTIDDREIGSASNQLSQPWNWVGLGRMRVDAGRHRVALVRGGGTLEPGNGDGRRVVGPLVLRPVAAPSALRKLAPEDWRRLCRRAFAWVEAVDGES